MIHRIVSLLTHTLWIWWKRA